MSITPLRVCAEKSIPPAVIENHIQNMEKMHPERLKAMIKNAGGNVLDCLGCHKISGDKKNHFHFQVPDSQTNTNQ
jgi:cytochrome c